LELEPKIFELKKKIVKFLLFCFFFVPKPWLNILSEFSKQTIKKNLRMYSKSKIHFAEKYTATEISLFLNWMQN